MQPHTREGKCQNLKIMSVQSVEYVRISAGARENSAFDLPRARKVAQPRRCQDPVGRRSLKLFDRPRGALVLVGGVRRADLSLIIMKTGIH